MTNSASFKIGDTVTLKSGSPAMTIELLDGVDNCWATCSWFEGGKRHKEKFRVETLERLEMPTGGKLAFRS